MRNERAAGDSRHGRTGKDGAFYNKDGVLLATVEQFTSNVSGTMLSIVFWATHKNMRQQIPFL